MSCTQTLALFVSHKLNSRTLLAEAWYGGRLNKLDTGGMRYDVLLIMQWLGDAVGERGKRLNGKQGRDPLHGAESAVIPESGEVPAVQLTTTDNPALLWDYIACMTETRGLLVYLCVNYNKHGRNDHSFSFRDVKGMLEQLGKQKVRERLVKICHTDMSILVSSGC